MRVERVGCRLCGDLIDPRDRTVTARMEVDLNVNRPRGANAPEDPGPVLGYTCLNCRTKRRNHVPIGQTGLAI